jgi:quercetin dioxygenase-like cupin family protein
MVSTFKPSPKLLAADEGDSFSMLSHLFTTKITGDETNGEWAMFEMTDSSQSGPPLHTHPWHETFYVLEGEMEVQVGNRKAIATPGTLLHVPENVAHTFKVCSPSVRVLVMIAPASAEAFYREVGARVTALPPDPEVFQEICAKYGVRILGA